MSNVCLSFAPQPGPASSSTSISTIVSTTFAYFGNRHLSFSHRARSSLGRETSFFFGINLITLVFSELLIALFVYPLHYEHGSLTVEEIIGAMNAVPPARRAQTQVRDALRAGFARKYTCPR